MPRGSATAEATIAPRTLIVANLGLVTMIFFWGSFFPVMEHVLKSWDPLSATAGRHLTAAVALTAVALAAERRLPFRRDLPWARLFLLGSIGFVLSSICMSLSVLWSSGVAAAIVSATNPISAAITARLLFGMSLGRGILLGAALAVTGSGIAILGAGTAFGEFQGFKGGELLVIVGNVAWTWFSLAAQRWLRGASQLDISLLTTVPGALCMTLVTVAAGGIGLVELRIDAAPEFLLPVLYTGTVPIAIGNFLWHFGVSRIGIAVSSMYTNLIPVTAALVAFVWIGTQPTLYQLVGGVIIIAGVFYAQVTALRSEQRR